MEEKFLLIMNQQWLSVGRVSEGWLLPLAHRYIPPHVNKN
jgi:hypothetical protein